MALSPFSLNPSATSPHTYTYTTSHSLYLLLLHRQTKFSSTSRALKFRVSCSQRLVEVQPRRIKLDLDTTNQRKKRKPKPSFLEQIEDKWSAKIGSQREKFPWQEESRWQEQLGLEEEEEKLEEKGTQISSDVCYSAKEIDLEQSKSDPLSFGLPSSKISAPWAHGIRTKPFKPQVEFEPKTSQNSDKLDENGDGFGGKFDNDITDGVMDKRKSFHEEVESGGEFEREFGTKSEKISKSDQKEKEEMSLTDVDGFSSSETSAEIGEDDSEASASGGLPWKREVKVVFKEGEKVMRSSNTELAEKMLPEHELKRLRNVSLRMLDRIKVGARGITQELVDSIHEKWKLDEVVKLKFEEPQSLNMKRTHEVLESRTGGLVIWRSGSSVVLYRGMTYNLPCVQSFAKQNQTDSKKSPDSKYVKSDTTLVKDSVKPAESSTSNSSEGEIVDLDGLNQILDDLGPRFTDWSGREPLPVDADLLPGIVPEYKIPFRLLPYGVKYCLRNRDMTKFRRLARSVPPHFALGRNRELQGLARAMVKLWEKSAIAKIAIKRGVQNTCNERMAEELKRLTGGTLLSRNKEFIVFYRGNDFLPPVVTETLKERRKVRDLQQDEEEQARQMASGFINSNKETSSDQLVAGTLAETKAATARWGNQLNRVDVSKMRRDSSKAKVASIVKHLQDKLATANGKLVLAEKALAKMQKNLDPSELPIDLETITDEERFLFRKIGLSMKPYLILGRREVFDGTIENMHLHWKFRELVKIIVRGKSFEQVKHIAINLEAESGGVLVSLDKTIKGYAIIVYRGKNYQAPLKIKPMNLLTRRQALARSIELQRREALRHHVADLKERIDLLKSEIEESEYKMIDDERISHSTLKDSLFSNDKGKRSKSSTYG
ncbi:hypothetical protein UlMin_022065 [Ulmus minor]